MKPIEEIKNIIQDRKPLFIKKLGLREIGIFGSYVRGGQEPKSDLDILVDFDEYPSLLDFIGMEEELSEHIGIKVDLVMKSGLKAKIGDRILREVIYL